MSRRPSRLSQSIGYDPFVLLGNQLAGDPRFVVVLFSKLESGDLENGSRIVSHFCRKANYLPQMLSALVTHSFESNKGTPGSVLRNEDIASKMTSIQTGSGTEYLVASIGPVIQEIISNPQISFEIDPMKVSMQCSAESGDTSQERINQIIERNRENLEKACDKIIERLMDKDAVAKIPRIMRAIGYMIRVNAEKYTPDSMEALVGGFFMLRFVNPSIINPEKRKLIPEKQQILPSARRNLILLSKVLQVSDIVSFVERFFVLFVCCRMIHGASAIWEVF
eukprot:TRINITY_DN7247_c0_g1_i2.p2 TRINITY_DN7247_c0_g1~~TRINITY_DN7247_c0_g1_i2.p2  ORF type:complete len:280 (+),score=44.01 TRINITY_DN7247_c0_g1_i2:69-908(+)